MLINWIKTRMVLGYLLVRQDLLDGTVDRRERKKRLEGNSQDIFEKDYQKE